MNRITPIFLFCLLPSVVAAHHPLAGAPMETFAHGLLSGIGHPLLGFDHLFFVALVGIAATFSNRRLLAPAAFILAMLVGCLLTIYWLELPAVEAIVALSLLVLGTMLLSGRKYAPATTLACFAGFGLFHGAAFGETLAAQEAAFGIEVTIGYLFGLGLIQYLLALASGWLGLALWKAGDPAAIQPRLAGAMVAGAGLLLVLEQIEGALIPLISG